MYDDDLSSIIVISIIFLATMIIIIGAVVYCKNKDIELERYKIEMQINNGDVPKEEGE